MGWQSQTPLSNWTTTTHRWTLFLSISKATLPQSMVLCPPLNSRLIQQPSRTVVFKMREENIKIIMVVVLDSRAWLHGPCEDPLPMGISRQAYWSGLPFPSPAGLPNPGFKPRSPALQADSLPSEPPGKPWFSLRAPQLFLFFPCCSWVWAEIIINFENELD